MKFPGKGLSWIFTYGSGLLNIKFKVSSHYLQVSSILYFTLDMQLLILLLFEDISVKSLKVS